MASKRKSLIDSEEESSVNDENDVPTGVDGEDKAEFEGEMEVDASIDILDNEASGTGETIPAGPVVPDVQLQPIPDGSIAHGPIEGFALQEVPNQKGLVEDVRVAEGELEEVSVEAGRFVNFVLDEGPNVGEVRPALVMRAWNGETGEMLNLLVFTDTDQEGRHNDRVGPILWRTSVPNGNKDLVGSWF